MSDTKGSRTTHFSLFIEFLVEEVPTFREHFLPSAGRKILNHVDQEGRAWRRFEIYRKSSEEDLPLDQQVREIWDDCPSEFKPLLPKMGPDEAYWKCSIWWEGDYVGGQVPLTRECIDILHESGVGLDLHVFVIGEPLGANPDAPPGAYDEGD